MTKESEHGLLVVITGPSGAGKDVIMGEVLKKNPRYARVVTTTSRTPRPGETKGKDYHFISREQFEILMEQNAFFESIEYRGEYYGTQTSALMALVKSSSVVIWRIDVSGAIKVRDKIKLLFPKCTFIFVNAENARNLEDRIQQRDTMDQPSLEWSVERARWEVSQAGQFENVVVNKEGKLTETVQKVYDIIKKTK